MKWMDEILIVFPVDESFYGLKTADCENLVDVEPCRSALVVVTVNGGKLASSPTLIRAHSGMSGDV